MRRVLIADDDPLIRRLLAGLLTAVGEVTCAADGAAALRLAQETPFDVVLLDIDMPGIDGHEVCARIKRSPSPRPQVIMVTGSSSRVEQIQAFEAGADDYVVKPFDAQELKARVALHFRLRDAEREAQSIRGTLASAHVELRRLAESRAEQIIATQEVAVLSLARAAELRDETTGEHILRMRDYAQQVAERLAQRRPFRRQITQSFLDNLYRSSPLHDIGKLGIPDAILRKPGKLTPEEFEEMKRHTTIGANLLDEAVFSSTCGGFLGMASVIARFHHERFDGQGYPAGLCGHEIPLAARIVAVADVYDALTSQRPYKQPYSPEKSRAMIVSESGKQFDPVVVDAFTGCFDVIVAIQERYDHQSEMAVGAMAFVEVTAPSAPQCAS